ncbi:MAG: GNAT family N-acetyltransferase [Chloroflexi bacterium]|nr:GNAT family N-acetyltransferase [Chloroflexota bacterium]
MIDIHSARTVDLPGVAAVMQEAFSDKMRVLVGRHPEKARALLEAAYAGPVSRGYDGLLVAERDGRVVGTLTLEPIYYTPQENRVLENTAIRELGLLRLLRASFLLWLIGHRPGEDEAYVSDVCVAPDCQGEGIGQLLLDYAEAWARDNDRSRMTLWVAATNDSAIHVYEKTGFEIVRTRSNLLTRLFFGIPRWHFKEKHLAASVVTYEYNDDADDRDGSPEPIL